MPLNKNSVVVSAVRWSGGWDLIIDDEHATSVADLNTAPGQVRDYLDTVFPGRSHAEIEVVVQRKDAATS
ncbi:hypothetical protein [Corynebacterium camporealensis]